MWRNEYHPSDVWGSEEVLVRVRGCLSGSLCFLRENLVLSSAVMSSLCSSHNLHELSPQHPGDTHESELIKAITLKQLTKCG